MIIHNQPPADHTQPLICRGPAWGLPPPDRPAATFLVATRYLNALQCAWGLIALRSDRV